jgi:hypothetical protein
LIIKHVTRKITAAIIEQHLCGAFCAYRIARVLHGWGQRSDKGCVAPAGAWKRQRGACVETNKTHVCDVGKRKRGLNFAVCVARSVNQ